MADQTAARLVEQVILAARRLRLPLGLAGHRADVAAPAAGAVDDDLCFVIAGFGMYEYMAALVLQTGDRASQPELDAVAHGGLRLRDAQPPRVDDRGARCVKRCDNVFRKVRLHLVRLLRVEDAQTRHAVADAVLEQVLEMLFLLLVERQNERADALVADRQVAAQLLHQLRAANVQLRHERAVLRVVACVNDGAVGLCRAHGNVVLALEHEHAQPVLRERIGKRCADHAAAHDGYIIHTFPSIFPTKKAKATTPQCFRSAATAYFDSNLQANKLIHFAVFNISQVLPVCKRFLLSRIAKRADMLFERIAVAVHRVFAHLRFHLRQPAVHEVGKARGGFLRVAQPH